MNIDHLAHKVERSTELLNLILGIWKFHNVLMERNEKTNLVWFLIQSFHQGMIWDRYDCSKTSAKKYVYFEQKKKWKVCSEYFCQ